MVKEYYYKNYEIHKSLAKNIKTVRVSKNVSISELSQMTGITKKYLEKIENAQAVGLSTRHLFKIAAALKVKPVEFVKDI